jgi:hypothetical protein
MHILFYKLTSNSLNKKKMHILFYKLTSNSLNKKFYFLPVQSGTWRPAAPEPGG